MSDLAARLSSIEARKQKLHEEENRLIQKRKSEIAEMAEKFGLLVASDYFISGLFQDAKTALENETEQLKNWTKQGEALFKSRKTVNHAKETKVDTSAIESVDA